MKDLLSQVIHSTGLTRDSMLDNDDGDDVNGHVVIAERDKDGKVRSASFVAETINSVDYLSEAGLKWVSLRVPKS